MARCVHRLLRVATDSTDKLCDCTATRAGQCHVIQVSVMVVWRLESALLIFVCFLDEYGKEARLAQSVERKTLNLVVVGSSPTVGVCFCLGGLCHIHSRVVSTLHRHSLRELAPDYVSTCLVG
ncbi:unnamed protein product [Peronospora effusa]|nr:unnamed protein product [Peronospora effusa]